MKADPVKAREIFLQALKCPNVEERDAYLREACGTDAELRRDVDILMEANEQAGSFLQNGALAAEHTIDQPITEKPGTVIGHYKLLQKIGEGGFGVVYMADQTAPVKRRVAIKVIKPGMDSRQVIARFEAERQALAMMDHPNIAKVLDAGTTNSGRPYFVMELVKGVPITQYCDEHHLTLQERLGLFVAVCQAVQHAHQKGIIHRDIKPTNVLVGEYDDLAVPRIIDFGVAKATEQRLTDKTIFTQFGQVVGTIEYMSPEQAKLNELDIDTRSDIYSLGVLLYELLTGETPFDRQRLRSAAFDELLRIIREEEPPKPSLRLSTCKSLPSVAANRHTEPTKLGTLIRGDLDWIVMKALEKERARRYETAGALAGDVRRFLSEEPIEARPPALFYTFRKFARRNKALLATGSIVAMVLIAASVVSTSFAAWAVREERVARGALRDVERQREVLTANHRRMQMSEAFSALRLGNMSRVESLMKNLRSAPRNGPTLGLGVLEAAIADTKPFRTFERSGKLESIAVSPQGQYLAMAKGKSGIVVHDIEKNVKRLLLPPDSNRVVRSVAFSPDGTGLLAGVGYDNGTGEVLRWKVVRQSEDIFEPLAFEVPLRHESPVCSIVVFQDPDAPLGASVGVDGVVLEWDIASGEVRDSVSQFELEGAPRDNVGNPITHIDLHASAKGERMAATRGPQLRIWERHPQKIVYTAENHHGRATLSPDGKLLVTSDACRTRLQRISAQGLADTDVPICWDFGWSLAFSPDGSILATGTASETSTLKIWDTRNWKLIGRLVHDGAVGRTTMSRDSRFLATSTSRSVSIWDMSQLTARALFTRDEQFDWLPALALSPDNRSVASRGENHSVVIWDTATGHVSRLLGHDNVVVGVSFSPDGTLLASASLDGTIRIWDIGQMTCLKTLPGVSESIFSVAFSPKGDRLASGGVKGELLLWDTATWTSSPLVGHSSPAAVISLAFSPDGNYLASGTVWSDPVETLVWDVSGSEHGPLSRIRSSVSVTSLSFSRNGSELAVGCNTSMLDVYDVRKPRDIRHAYGLSGTGSWLTGVAFSPAGNNLVTAGASGEVRIWDSNSRKEEAIFRVPDRVRKVAFFPNGKTFVTASMDGLLRVWRTDASDP